MLAALFVVAAIHSGLIALLVGGAAAFLMVPAAIARGSGSGLVLVILHARLRFFAVAAGGSCIPRAARRGFLAVCHLVVAATGLPLRSVTLFAAARASCLGLGRSTVWSS
jgi:hypothetical protein